MSREAEIRRDLIDKQLAEAGWSREQGNLVTEMFLSGKGKHIEEHFQDYLPPTGTEGSRAFADYVLLGKDGEPLAVLEAKRDSRSPLEGERQAVEYAESIYQKTGRLPFIFLSNGDETYFIDKGRYPARRVNGFFTQDDLERLDLLLYWLLRISVREKYLENDLLVLCCLQERSGKGRIREHACTSCIGIFLFLCKGVTCVPCSHPSQTTTSSSLSRALRWHGLLDETPLHLSSAWNDRRSCQREVRTACRKRVVTAATHHPASANQTTGLQEDRSVPLVARCARMMRTWKQALFIVQPETLLRWHRELFRFFWKHTSKADSRQPKLSPETIALIKEMTRNNQLWGAERIRGELLKLDIRKSQTNDSEVHERHSYASPNGAKLADVSAQSWGRDLGL